MSKYVTATRHTYRLLSLGYLLLSWSLLLWLNFAIEPNVFAHLVAIPSLLLRVGRDSDEIRHIIP